MKINLDVVFKDFENEDVKKQIVKEVDGPDGKKVVETKDVPLTLRIVCTDALMSMPKNPDSFTGDQKVERYELAKRIYEGGTIDLEAEQVALLKRLIGENYVPLIVGPAFEMLEGK